ncbi:MAG: pyridoxine 4-dehydrogenase [Solirubrobacterales bacterium]|nr:pyridoxine 4-dehydrogenase [Solirubrobacterales bacterium]
MSYLGDKQPTRIGLGTNRLTDTPANRDFLEQAVAAGVDFIDTAHLYTSGESEATIGATLAPFKPGLTVATKGGYVSGTGPDGLREQIEESLERLRTETIELYYLHRVDPLYSIEALVSVIAEYRTMGRIKQVGVSEVSIEQIQLAQAVVPIAAVQNEFNLGTHTDGEVVDFCAEREILFVPFFPLRGGDTAAIEEVAAETGATAHQVKLAWLLKRSPAMLPIPGTRSIEHLRENLGALDVELSDEQFQRLAGDA